MTLCVAPTQWSLEPRPKLHLSPADLTLAFTAGVWFLNLWVSRGWRRLLRDLPWAPLLFVACAAASAAVAADKGAAAKDLVQFVEYFLVGTLVFEAFLRDGGALAVRRALAVLGCVAAVNLGLALLQYFGPAENPLAVRGSFGNRNVLGGFLALALPLCFAGAAAARGWLVKVLCALLFVAGLTVNLSGASYFAVAVAVAGMAAARGLRLFLPVAALLAVWQILVLPELPRKNDLVHFRSVALYDEAGQVERRYPDWQAAYSMALTQPWLGVGLGNYQKHVGQYYDNVPRQTGPSEPDIQNLYLVLAASCGWPALFAFLALFAVAARPAAAEGLRPLSWGVSGALAAFALTAVWHPLLVRGIGLPLVFLFALARHLSHPEVRGER